jgi:DNA-binding NarL/FixJ family response regulator
LLDAVCGFLAVVLTTVHALSQYQSVVIPCTSEEAVQAVIVHRRVDVVVLNLSKPFEKCFRLLSDIQSKAPQTEVIFVAQFDERMLRAWMEVIQRGLMNFAKALGWGRIEAPYRAGG